MNFQNLVQQAQKMQKQVEKQKKDFEDKTFELEGQNGKIKGIMNGRFEIKELNIDEDLLQDKEMLEDLLMVTINQTMAKIAKEKDDTLEKVTNGVDVSAFF